MKISDIKTGEGKIDVQGTITNIGETRVFNKFGRDLKVANAMLEDDSGKIKLSLWNDDIMKVKEGAQIKISNGWCSEFQGEKQLSAGKFGKIELLE
jgi:replication factor A1